MLPCQVHSSFAAVKAEKDGLAQQLQAAGAATAPQAQVLPDTPARPDAGQMRQLFADNLALKEQLAAVQAQLADNSAGAPRSPLSQQCEAAAAEGQVQEAATELRTECERLRGECEALRQQLAAALQQSEQLVASLDAAQQQQQVRTDFTSLSAPK